MSRPRLGFLQICNMCFGFLGIQIGFALQNANTSRIFQTLGANNDNLPVLWLAAPATGLLVQPVIGYLSDRTWGPLGRRRPYFLVGALLTSIALVFMPLSPVLWIAAGMLWLMDASINVTMEPFRAFVGDLLPDEQRAMGFATQSFFIGIGAVFASALPWMLSNWFAVSNTAPQGLVPDSVRLAFHIGAAALLVSVLWTVFSSREYSPEEMAKFEAKTPVPSAANDAGVAAPSNARLLLNGSIWIVVGLIGALGVLEWHLEKELYILFGFITFYGALQIISAAFRHTRSLSGLVEIIGDLYAMPNTMRQLAVVQFFAWFGLFSMWIYTTPAVTQVQFHALDNHSAAYNRGADWVGILFSVYNGIAALAAFLLPVLAARIGRRQTHALCLILGAMGLAGIWLIQSPGLLIYSMIGVGVAWAAILSMPYAILTGSLPSSKMGVYMGIFNIFIVIPQLVAATILGLLLRQFFHNQAIFALILGAISMLLAALACVFVQDEADPANRSRALRAL